MTQEQSHSKPHRAAESDGPGMIYKASLVTLVCLAFVVPLALAAVPFVEFFNGMAAQPKGKTQMTYGRTYGLDAPVERLPQVGTIPRGYTPTGLDGFGNTIEEAKSVGAGLTNPVSPTMEHLRRGQETYNVFCIVCHGRRGEGDGSVIGPNRFPAPPTLHTDQARGYSDGTIFFIISKGVGKMPSYAEQLEPEERWEVVHYLHALQRAMNPKPEDLP